jgi:hypothetical protein
MSHVFDGHKVLNFAQVPAGGGVTLVAPSTLCLFAA